MNGVNYLLLFKGDSDKGGPEASVRGFNKLEAARAAMVAAYKKMAASMDIPVGSNVSSDPYTIRAKKQYPAGAVRRLVPMGDHQS